MKDAQYYLNFVEAFQIFAKYGDGYVAAEHDIIYAGGNPEDVSEEDKARLEVLGWSVSDEYDCFYHFT